MGESALPESNYMPGSVSSIAFMIEPDLMDTVDFQLSVISFSHYITPILHSEIKRLAPGPKVLYLVPFRMDPFTPHGKQDICLEVKNLHNGHTFSLSKAIQVAAIQKVSLINTDIPDYINITDTLKSRFLLVNEGNTAMAFTLSCQGADITSASNIQLQPGASTTVTTSKHFLKNSSNNQGVSIQLTATSIDNPLDKWTAYANTTLICTDSEQKDAYFRFPIQASIANITMKQNGQTYHGLQTAVTGSGSLNTALTDKLSFQAITPTGTPYSSFTQYESYFVDYQNKHLLAHVGDDNYSASYLTSLNRYGRGAAMQYRFQHIMIGGFYNRPRFYGNIKEQFNLYAKLPTRHMDFIAGLLRNQEINSALSQQASAPASVYLPYIAINSSLLNDVIKLESELAYSTTEQHTAKAYRIHAYTHFKSLSTDLSFMQSDKDFKGYFRGAGAFNANTHYRISPTLTANLQWTQDARHIAMDSIFIPAPLSKTHELSLSYAYTKEGHIELFAGDRSYKDRMPVKVFNYKENFIRLDITHQLSCFNFNAEAEIAQTRNFLSQRTSTASYYSSALGYDNGPWSINLYGSYAHTSRYQEANQRIFYYGARLSTKMSTGNNLSFFYQNNYKPEDIYKNRNLVELLFQQRFIKNNLLEASCRYSLQQAERNKKDYIFSIKYTVLLKAPIKKIAQYTSLAGQVSFVGGADPYDLSTLKIQLDDQVTRPDKNGYYSFKNILLGEHYLSLNTSALKASTISTLVLPQKIQLAATHNIKNIELTTAASLRVNLIRVGNDQMEGEAEKMLKDKFKDNQQNNFLIELKKDAEVYRQLCSLEQPIDFSMLRPGTWQIHIAAAGALKDYKIMQDSFEISLAPGEKQTLPIQIIEKAYKVNYQNGGLQVSYKN